MAYTLSYTAISATGALAMVLFFGAPVPTSIGVVDSSVSEARLIIPKIEVNARIQAMGVTSAGAMAVPGNRVDVGWYRLGTRPGQWGSAVIGGHSAWDGGSGVFGRLDQLSRGDIISVVDAKGVMVSFIVRGTQTFDATDTDSGIFASASGTHLNLITCSGVWDPATQSYTTRLVIFSDLALIR